MRKTAMVNISEISYSGWKHCLEMKNNHLKLIVTTDVGPRVIYFGRPDGENVFHQRKGQQGLVNSKEWLSYGGHRLWHSPQIGSRPNQPDNEQVPYDIHENTIQLNCPEETATRVQKQFCITMVEDESKVTVCHRIYNRGLWPIRLATWALSVMQAGGVGILPVPQEQTPDYLPNFAIAYWPWTRTNDSRFTLGEKYMTLKQDPANKQWFKIGFRNTEGWGVYLYKEYMFVKRYSLNPLEEYPDYGSSFQIYTDNEIMELETLGPLKTITNGEYTEHTEEWYLFNNITVPRNEEEIEKEIAQPILKIIRANGDSK
jgi:hypothetical protein